MVSQANGRNNPTEFKLQLKRSLTGHKGQVYALVVSPNGELLASVGERENSTRLWDTVTGQLIAEVDGFARQFSPDGNALLTTREKSAKLWEAATGKLKFNLAGHEMEITDASFSADGNRVATGSADGTVRLWDANSGTVSHTLTLSNVKKLPWFRIFSKALQFPLKVFAKFSPDGKFMATQAIDLVNINVVSLWETATGQLIKEYKDLFQVIEFSQDSKWLGFLTLAQDVGLLNLESLMIQPTSGVDTGFLNQNVFSRNSKSYVIGSGFKNYHATLIDVSTGQVKKEIPLVSKWGFDMISDFQKDVDILSFHPNSRVLMGANHQSVRMWNVSTGDLILETREGRDPAAFSTDGKLLVTVAPDKKTVLLWDVTY